MATSHTCGPETISAAVWALGPLGPDIARELTGRRRGRLFGYKRLLDSMGNEVSPRPSSSRCGRRPVPAGRASRWRRCSSQSRPRRTGLSARVEMSRSPTRIRSCTPGARRTSSCTCVRRARVSPRARATRRSRRRRRPRPADPGRGSSRVGGPAAPRATVQAHAGVAPVLGQPGPLAGGTLDLFNFLIKQTVFFIIKTTTKAKKIQLSANYSKASK